VGDFFDVFVLRYNYRDKVIVGSIKKLHPEENPYRELSRLLPGTRLSGRLDLELADDVLVLLENGARGNIPKKLMPSPFGKNEMVDVVISALDVEQGQLTLEPVPGDVRPVPPSANQPSPDPMLA
jgi:hypothetical protein